MADKSEEKLSPDEIEQRMNAAMRRALNTPPKPTKELIGKSERAKSQRETKAIRANQAKPKDDAAS